MVSPSCPSIGGTVGWWMSSLRPVRPRNAPGTAVVAPLRAGRERIVRQGQAWCLEPMSHPGRWYIEKYMSSDFPSIGVIGVIRGRNHWIAPSAPCNASNASPVRSLWFPHWTSLSLETHSEPTGARSPLWDAAVCSLLATLPWWGACQHLEAYQVMGWWSRIVMRCVHGHWLPKSCFYRHHLGPCQTSLFTRDDCVI